jgi:hypothetical protein
MKTNRNIMSVSCDICHRRARIPAFVARAIRAGIVALEGYVCPVCAEADAGRALLTGWSAPAPQADRSRGRHEMSDPALHLVRRNRALPPLGRARHRPLSASLTGFSHLPPTKAGRINGRKVSEAGLASLSD